MEVQSMAHLEASHWSVDSQFLDWLSYPSIVGPSVGNIGFEESLFPNQASYKHHDFPDENTQCFILKLLVIYTAWQDIELKDRTHLKTTGLQSDSKRKFLTAIG